MSAVRAAFVTLGRLAVWNALYAASLVVAVGGLLNVPLEPIAIVGASFLALGVFLLDRVKPRDAMLDPADEAADPRRFTFHRAHARTLRAFVVLCVATGVACMTLGGRPIAAALGIAAPLGVLVYGTLRPPGGVRLKDRPIRKNLSVAMALACFATVIALAPALRLDPASLLGRAPAELCAFVWIVLVVFADAALCDLDDAPSDAVFGTRTLANTLPERRLWLIALTLQIAAAPMAFWAGALSGAQRPVLVGWWAFAPVVTTLLVRLARPARVRDVIDARLALVGVVAILLGRVTR